MKTVVLAWGGKEIGVKLLGADADRQGMARRRRTKAGQLISAQPGAEDE